MPNWLKKVGKAVEKAGRDVSVAVDKAARQVDGVVSEAAGMPEGATIGSALKPSSVHHKDAVAFLKGQTPPSAAAPAPVSAAVPDPAPEVDPDLAAAIKLSLQDVDNRVGEPQDLRAYFSSAAAPEATSDPTTSVSAPVDASAPSSTHVTMAGEVVDPMQFM